MNKLEKVSSDCHLMALAGGGARSRGGHRSDVQGGSWGGQVKCPEGRGKGQGGGGAVQ